MSPSSTSTVIFAWAALIVLWAAMFIFYRRLRTDLLEFRLTQILATLRTLTVSAGPLSVPDIRQLEAVVQAGLQLSELWSGSVLLMVRGRSRSTAFASAAASELGSEIGRVIASHIVRGCPLLWPTLFVKPWLDRLETMVLAICFTQQSGDLQ